MVLFDKLCYCFHVFTNLNVDYSFIIKYIRSTTAENKTDYVSIYTDMYPVMTLYIALLEIEFIVP